MANFLSCDWGTSAFRLRLIDTDGLTVLAELSAGEGIADTHNRWEQRHKEVGARSAFYAASLQVGIAELRNRAGTSLDGLPVVLSGMASSSIGMVELPYKRMPFSLDGSDLVVETLTAESVQNPILIVSGACTADDAMRGEETKVLGCSSLLADDTSQHLLIFPGTHPKHVTVVGDQAVGLTTYMTGEFFKLLSTHSVLASSIKKGADFEDTESQRWFGEGVHAGVEVGTLQGAFRVRTNQLLKQVPETYNYYYLSGLLIGTELSAVGLAAPVYLVSGVTHEALYRSALLQLGVPIAGAMDADQALMRGQWKILSRVFSI